VLKFSLHRLYAAITAVSLLVCIEHAYAAQDIDWDLSGYVAGETRAYTDTPSFPRQKDKPDYSFVYNPELRFKSKDNKHQVTIIPFGRIDSIDHERTHFDMREAYYLNAGDSMTYLIGIDKVFWGVTESKHLVDIVNQTDGVEDIDGEAKLGQPMLNASMSRDWGTLDFYLMPYFRERTFAGEKGRLRASLSIDTDNPVYESNAEEYHVDAAIRYSHYRGDWDFGISHFYGTSREPRLIANSSGDKFIPHYDIINQTGIDIQLTQDAWLWKLEAIAREGQGDFFVALSSGFEYTFYQIARSNADLGLLAEYHYDGRDSRAPATALDDDIFAALRLTFNDIQDTALLAGLTIDPLTDEIFYNLEAETRIGDNWKLELRLRVFSGPIDVNDALRSIDTDDYLQLRLAYYI
jgi:hypothetical protein